MIQLIFQLIPYKYTIYIINSHLLSKSKKNKI